MPALTINDRAAYRMFGLAYDDLNAAQQAAVRDIIAARVTAE